MTEEEFDEAMMAHENIIVGKLDKGEITVDQALFLDKKISEWQDKFYEEAGQCLAQTAVSFGGTKE